MSTLDTSIRPEQPGDEDRIDLVVSRAFDKTDEANLVRMLRTRQPGFDRELSVCAWAQDRMVGYTGFIPVPMRLLGHRISAVAVAPVAVVPECQRQGVAGAMLRWGHRAAARRGARVAFLNGHPGYYPRHGYGACFGFCSVTVNPEALPPPRLPLEAWPVRQADIPWLVACDEREWGDVDFTWPRGRSLAEWAIEGVNAVLWRTADGCRAAYTLSRPGQPRRSGVLETVLGEDPERVRQVIAHVRPTRMTHHPGGWLARHVLDPAWANCQARRSDAAMALSLVDGALDEYMDRLARGERLSGVVNWPIPFIMC
ncbi:MAG: GNAT family N-acetyltransferase [Candidatus Latescibacterota bacterium]